MANAFLLLRLLLGAVFAVAGFAKLADRPGARRAIVEFGLPDALAGPLAWLVPLTELGVALALLPVQSAWLGAVGALALLVVFLAGIGVNLARGRHPDCHCFGQLHSAPIGAGAILRNLALALVALALVLSGPDRAGPSAVDWLGALGPGQLIGVLAAGFGLVLLAAVTRELRALRQQLLGLEVVLAARSIASAPASEPALPAQAQPSRARPVGAPAPAFDLPDLHGARWDLDDLLARGRSVLLLFVDAQCGPCASLLPDIGRWQREGGELVVAAISRGAADVNRAKAAEHGLTLVLLQDDREVSRAYGVPGTPGAVLIGPGGRVASAMAAGADAIRALHAVASRPTLVAVGAKVGDGGSPVGQLANDQPEPAPLDPAARPAPRPGLTVAELDGETVLYDPGNGQVHQLNATATLVWSLCDGQRTAEEIALRVAETYAIPLDQARADTAELLAGLRDANLVVM